jgi:predicted O-methyltransferase YrrM
MTIFNYDNMLESNFTSPRDDCPNPEYWHSDDNESTEWEVIELLVGFVRALQPEFMVETGTAFGAATYELACALKNNGHGKMVSIEQDSERVIQAKRRCLGLPVEIICADALYYMPEDSVDFAWIDTGGNRAAELKVLAPYLSQNAIVGIHDVGPQHLVWNSLIENKLLTSVGGEFNYIKLPTPRGVAFLQRAS